LSLLSPPNALQLLISPTQYSELLQPNVIDRDHVFVPSGWDSWGKIRVLRDGFDVEGVCEGWSVDIASVLAGKPENGEVEKKQPEGGALEVYEDTVSDPKRVSAIKEGVLIILVEFRFHDSLYRTGHEYRNNYSRTSVFTATSDDNGIKNVKGTT
jgi:hypothetical protein